MDKIKQTNDYVAIYKEQLANGEIQIAYERLIKYMMTVKAEFSKELADKYQTGNVSPGYMDFTYFPFSNDYMRSKKLRFGIVLNHRKMRFELWLMGRNADVQHEYWNLLKTTDWNKEQTTMPKYSVLEAVLVENPDFNAPDLLAEKILKASDSISEEVTDYIKKNCS